MYSKLVDCPLFRGFNEQSIQNIIEGRSDITSYRGGEYIARRDTAYSGLMIILEGKVRGVMTYSSGKKINVEALEAPQLIAPAFLFGGYNRIPIDVIAEGDTQILTIHRGYLFELMQDNILILSNFIDIISDRANVWSKKMYYFSFRTLKEKVVNYLLDNASADNCAVAMPGNTEISGYFDATRSAVNTVIAELVKKQWIKVEGGNIVVLNRDALSDAIK